jgi:hypothetical protein
VQLWLRQRTHASMLAAHGPSVPPRVSWRGNGSCDRGAARLIRSPLSSAYAAEMRSAIRRRGELPEVNLSVGLAAFGQ